MGWISRRHMQTGGSINRNPKKQRKGPLRKIAFEIRASTGIFDPAYVELECGHRCHSHGAFKARCVDCAEKEPAQNGR
jgi:hypothetical protein